MKEGPEPRGGKGETGFEYPLELKEGLFVEGHKVYILDRQALAFEAVGDRLAGEAVVVLPSRKPLLLRGGDNPAVPDKACGAVMIKGGYAEDVH